MKRASTTSGGPPSWTRSSARRTASSPRRSSASPQAGTFERGTSVLQRRAEPADADAGRLDRVRQALLAARRRRIPPGRDDKVVAAWNGLAISALAECGLLLGRPDFIDAARAAATVLAEVHYGRGRLVRTSRHGSAGDTAGVLEDYACVAEGLLTLSGVTGEARWLTLAGQLLDTALDCLRGRAGRFLRHGGGRRSADLPPGGRGRQRHAVRHVRHVRGAAQLRRADRLRPASRGRRGRPGRAARHRGPVSARGAARAWRWPRPVLAGPAEIAIIGHHDDERTRVLHRTALHAAPPGAVLALGDGTDETVPLLAGRGPVDGAPAAYVCREFTCLAPVTTPEELRAALAAPSPVS